MSSGLTLEEKLKIVKEYIRSFPDFPKPGILFRDIFSALKSGYVCKLLKEILIEYVQDNFKDVEAVVGLDARGFLFCFAIASELEISCIPVRKRGKLPGKTIKYEYQLEYGSDVFEVQKDSFNQPGLKCIIIDDLIATGGSMLAAINLLQQNNANILGCLAIMELVDLKGRDKLPKDISVHSLVKY